MVPLEQLEYFHPETSGHPGVNGSGFWKERWLKRMESEPTPRTAHSDPRIHPPLVVSFLWPHELQAHAYEARQNRQHRHQQRMEQPKRRIRHREPTEMVRRDEAGEKGETAPGKMENARENMFICIYIYIYTYLFRRFSAGGCCCESNRDSCLISRQFGCQILQVSHVTFFTTPLQSFGTLQGIISWTWHPTISESHLPQLPASANPHAPPTNPRNPANFPNGRGAYSSLTPP